MPNTFEDHGTPEEPETLLEIAEDAAIAKTVAERTSADTGERLTLQESAEELGIDLDDL